MRSMKDFFQFLEDVTGAHRASSIAACEPFSAFIEELLNFKKSGVDPEKVSDVYASTMLTDKEWNGFIKKFQKIYKKHKKKLLEALDLQQKLHSIKV